MVCPIPYGDHNNKFKWSFADILSTCQLHISPTDWNLV